MTARAHGRHRFCDYPGPYCTVSTGACGTEDLVPGRIPDQLKRITREQGGALPSPDDSLPSRPQGTRYGPLIALAVVVLLAGVGWVVVERLMAMSRTQDCVMSGRKNCAPVDTASP
jgi:hypothetical protein